MNIIAPSRSSSSPTWWVVSANILMQSLSVRLTFDVPNYEKRANKSLKLLLIREYEPTNFNFLIIVDMVITYYVMLRLGGFL